MSSNVQNLEHHNITIAMPNEIFHDIREWLIIGEVKSKMHQEFIYSYYWYITYLWRYCLYNTEEITQKTIKQALGYNPNEKRIDYIIKRNGLLDQKSYTTSTTDFAVTWSLEGNDLSFSMLSDYDEVSREYLSQQITGRNVVKRPVLHVGDEGNEGIFWNSANTHYMDFDIFQLCMSDRKLGCAGFYMYGILKSMSDKNRYFNDDDYFNCSNETLVNVTSWDVKRIIQITNSLMDCGLIDKEQRIKVKGSVNYFGVV